MVKAKKLPSGAWNIMVFSHMEGEKRKYKSITRPTKAEAEYAAAEFRRTKQRSAGRTEGYTVSDAITEYIRISEVLSPTTLDAYKKIQAYAFGSLMDKNVDDLRDVDVQQAINNECKRISKSTGRQLSPKTVKNEWGLVSSALKSVCNRSYNIKLPKVARRNSDLPEPSEIMAAVEGTIVELPCLLAMWCGLRLSEIKGITYDSIKGNVLTIDKVMVSVGGASVLKSLGKTDQSLRKVILPEHILDLIEKKPRDPEGFVVDISRNAIYYHYKKAIKQFDIDISFHDLRHVFASVMLVKLQVAQQIVQDAGGWATPDVMLKVYSQSFAANRIEADRLRDEYFENARRQCKTNQ